jgi:hypothetical protein
MRSVKSEDWCDVVHAFEMLRIAKRAQRYVFQYHSVRTVDRKKHFPELCVRRHLVRRKLLLLSEEYSHRMRRIFHLATLNDICLRLSLSSSERNFSEELNGNPYSSGVLALCIRLFHILVLFII